MQKIFNSRVTYVWFFLAALTCLTWFLGDGYDPASPELFKIFSISLLGLAFFKVRLVIMHFMEIGNAPVVLRLIFESWLLVICGILILLYLFGAAMDF